MYVLDTNVVSELRKVGNGKAHRGVTEWAASIPSPNLYLSVITILELEQGVLLVERRDRRQGKALRQWLEDRVIPAFAGRVLPIDTDVARQCARLHVPDPKSERDALIAATALVHGMIIVTRNEDDFAACGVRVMNPWLHR